jgi:hypothetical protein
VIHFKEKIIPKSETATEMRVHFDEETMAALIRLKEIWSHANPHASFADVIKRAAGEAVDKHDPLKKADRSENRARKKAKQKTARDVATKAPTETEAETAATIAAKTAITTATAAEATTAAEIATEILIDSSASAQKCSRAEIKRHVWKRDEAQCAFIDPRTGKRCSARHFVEEDHIIPKAMGGEYSVENLRLRCRAHNQRHAIDCYGRGKMRDYITSMNS